MPLLIPGPDSWSESTPKSKKNCR